MAKSTTHIRRHLRASQPVAALLDEIERRERLLSQLRRHLPADLAAHCCQATLSAGELTLFVDSPVWVDRFRFLCPELIGSGFVAGHDPVDTEIKACKVRVLPPATGSVSRSNSPRRDRPDPRLLPESRGSGDDAGPSALSQALARLARTLGRSSC